MINFSGTVHLNQTLISKNPGIHNQQLELQSVGKDGMQINEHFKSKSTSAIATCQVETPI